VGSLRNCGLLKQQLWCFKVIPENSKLINNSVALVHEQTVLTKRPLLVSKVSVNFLQTEGCCVVRVTDPHSRILGFLDRNL
jgi:hypothetical protein